MTWFKLLDESIHQSKIFDANNPNPFNTALPLIDQLDPEARDNILKERIDGQKKLNQDITSFIVKRILGRPVTKDEEVRSIGSKKAIYVIAVSIVSSLTAVIANASFLGNILMTAAVGIAIGFAAYRVQDIVGLLAPNMSATNTAS